MLSIEDRELRLCDGIGRRKWLHRVAGGRRAGFERFADLCQAGAATTGTQSGFGRAKACIVLFMLGGPPQHETWDPKPDAAEEIRGALKPIASARPVCRSAS